MYVCSGEIADTASRPGFEKKARRLSPIEFDQRIHTNASPLLLDDAAMNIEANDGEHDGT